MKKDKWISFANLRFSTIFKLRNKLQPIQKSLVKIESKLEQTQGILEGIRILVGVVQTFESLIKRGLWTFVELTLKEISKIVTDAKSTGIYFLDLTTYHINAVKNENKTFIEHAGAWFDNYTKENQEEEKKENKDFVQWTKDFYSTSQKELYLSETYQEFIEKIIEAFNDINDKPSNEMFKKIFNNQYTKNLGFDYLGDKINYNTLDIQNPANTLWNTGRPIFSEDSRFFCAIVAFCFPANMIQSVGETMYLLGKFISSIKDSWDDIEAIFSKLNISSEIDIQNMKDLYIKTLNQQNQYVIPEEPNFVGMSVYQIFHPVFTLFESLISTLENSSYDYDHNIYDTILNLIDRVEVELENIKNIVTSLEKIIKLLDDLLFLTSLNVLFINSNQGVPGFINKLKNAEETFFDNAVNIQLIKSKLNEIKLKNFTVTQSHRDEIINRIVCKNNDIRVFEATQKSVLIDIKNDQKYNYNQYELTKKNVEATNNKIILLNSVNSKIDSYKSFLVQEDYFTKEYNYNEVKKENDEIIKNNNSQILILSNEEMGPEFINEKITTAQINIQDDNDVIVAFNSEINNTQIQIDALDNNDPEYNIKLSNLNNQKNSYTTALNNYISENENVIDYYTSIKNVIDSCEGYTLTQIENKINDLDSQLQSKRNSLTQLNTEHSNYITASSMELANYESDLDDYNELFVNVNSEIASNENICYYYEPVKSNWPTYYNTGNTGFDEAYSKLAIEYNIYDGLYEYIDVIQQNIVDVKTDITNLNIAINQELQEYELESATLQDEIKTLYSYKNAVSKYHQIVELENEIVDRTEENNLLYELNKIKNNGNELYLDYNSDSYKPIFNILNINTGSIFNKNHPTYRESEMIQNTKIKLLNELEQETLTMNYYNSKQIYYSICYDLLELVDIDDIKKFGEVWSPDKKMYYGGFLICGGYPNNVTSIERTFGEILAKTTDTYKNEYNSLFMDIDNSVRLIKGEEENDEVSKNKVNKYYDKLKGFF